ncbi:N-acetylmuramoyl-L-alanine amidase [Butyrivibrio sp. YAB3001]|uniref:N-acetylmuramoyl-L-alanine amidase n=1 Tax=Butyrivibrio sp. YAB3001 TaxID=1520812 RepID=UPI0008F664A7|nr:N-acetylmuramoyl-L-alanine amidase [Butyrivibrio sp. YAB3001]SFB87137.1 N-acetylmuramoyl-L-alanine amidase [Butyrivibrio sp. YAB3001]
MNNSEMKKMLIRASIFTGACLFVMLQRSATKHIMISDAAEITVDINENQSSYELLIDNNVSKGQSGKLIIPMPKNVDSDDIILEDKYIDHEFKIHINSGDEDFYRDAKILTDLGIVKEAECISENEHGDICLDFKLDGLYANESSLTESRNIEVRFFRPYEEYDKIVVVDPDYEGSFSDEAFSATASNDLSLDVALELKKVAEKDEENKIKIYFTRLDKSDAGIERKQQLIEETRPDLVVGLGMETVDGPDNSGVTTRYNESFFLRRLSNADFASILEKECVASTMTNAGGVIAADESDSLLMESIVPSARVITGYPAGSENKKAIYSEEYQNKLASGIYQGIKDAFEVME